MTVWIVIAYEPVPHVDVGARLLRCGRLAETFRRAGHNVVFWTSTFDHPRKRSRYEADLLITPYSNYAVRFLYGPPYRKNTSWGRVVHNQAIARSFEHQAATLEPPALIFAAIPCLELVEAAVRYGRTRFVPVVVDVQDVWPDIYLNVLPRGLRWLGRGILFTEFRRARWACQNAAALTAVSRTYLRWAMKHARRGQQPGDGVFYLGADDPYSRDPRINLQLKERARLRFNVPEAGVRAIYLGQFGQSYDVATIVNAAEIDLRSGKAVTYILVGGGDNEQRLRERARGLSNIQFLGWLGVEDATGLLLNSDIAIAAYAATATQSMPYKPFEYMAAGLPIVSSLRGELDELIEVQRIGCRYRAGDPQSLASGVGHFARDVRLRAESAARAREVFCRDFSEAAVYPRLLAHLLRIANQG